MPRPEAASVVLILIDTLRADHLGTYGYARPTSPRIDQLATESILFEQVRSVAPWTNSTIASLFTGSRPTAVLEPMGHSQAVWLALPAALPTLAERLRQAGLATVALVDHPGIAPSLGYDRGFERFVQLFRASGSPVWGSTNAGFVVEELERQADQLANRRFFLYLHLIYPHRPYAPPPPYEGFFGESTTRAEPELRDELINAYDSEIRFADAVVGDLLDALRRRNLLDASWVIVTSDHGEGFWEHGRSEHGNSLYDELLHVPLLIRPPAGSGLAARRIDRPVSLIDLHATILEAAGAPGEAGGDGTSFFDFWSPERPAGERRVVSQQPHSGDVQGAAIVRAPWKLIRWRDKKRRGPIQLYHLERDREEKEDRAAAEPDLARRLDRELLGLLELDRRRRERLGVTAPGTLDAESEARLRALGYI